MKLYFLNTISHFPNKIGRVLSIAIGCFMVLYLPAQTTPEFRGVWVATVDNIDWPNKKWSCCLLHICIVSLFYAIFHSILRVVSR
jgi:hypothetical protein